jgi:hypothetical protein
VGYRSGFAKAMEEYVKPLIDDYASKKTAEDTTTHTITNGISADIGLGKTSSIKPSAKDELQEKHGVTLMEDTTRHVYVPRSIAIYRRSDSKVEDIVNSAQQVYISNGPAATSTPDEVPITVSESNTSYGTPSSESQFIGIVPGMAVCFLSDMSVPLGYVELNGNSNWPVSNWVPAPLRGKVVVDIKNALIGGGDSGNVAQVTDDGALTLSGTLTVANATASAKGITTEHFDDNQGGGIGYYHRVIDRAASDPLTLGEETTSKHRVGLTAIKEASSATGTMSGKISIAAAPSYLHCRWIVRTAP